MGLGLGPRMGWGGQFNVSGDCRHIVKEMFVVLFKQTLLPLASLLELLTLKKLTAPLKGKS